MNLSELAEAEEAAWENFVAIATEDDHRIAEAEAAYRSWIEADEALDAELEYWLDVLEG